MDNHVSNPIETQTKDNPAKIIGGGTKERESSIELLKIIAIFLIVISHTTQTLISKNIFIPLGFNDGFIELTATCNIKYFIIMIIRHFGALGNLIFITCSSYFLVDRKKCNWKKVLKLWCNTFIISIIILAIYLIAGTDLDGKTIIQQFFPIILQNNWFVTVYIMFIIIIPYLNILIDKLNQKQLFRVSLLLFCAYFIIGFVRDSFQSTALVYFITIYFIVTYIKKYMSDFWMKKKNCIMMLFIGIMGVIILELVTNLLGLKFDFMKDEILHWVKNNNPLLLLIAISLFYLFKRLTFKNSFINLVSSLTIYIYLVHENNLVRNYTRAYAWHYLYEKFGYDHVIIMIFMYAIALFIFSAICSYIYKISIEKIANHVIEKVYNSKRLKNKYIKIENKLINIK